jgi:hypothetical protein
VKGAARRVTAGALLRPALVLALAVVWLLPWADVQGAGTGGLVTQRGVERAGPAAPAALVLLWSLSLAALAGVRAAALRSGEAFAAAAVCGLAAALIATGRLGAPTAERAGTWLPIFVPLGLLALLEAGSRLAGAGSERTIGVVRVAAAAFAAAVLALDGAWAPAAFAGWVALAPLAFVRARDAHAERRGLEGLALLAALLAGFAPTLAQRLATLPAPVGGIGVAAVGWSVLAALVVLISTAGLLAPREDA